MYLKDKTVAIDVDEVLFDTHAQFVSCLIKKFGDHPDRYPFLLDEWEMETILTGEECAYLWGESGYRSVDFHRQLRFKPHAVETMYTILENSYEAFVVTDCPPEVQQERKLALTSTFPNLPVYFTGHKYSQNPEKAKSKAELIDFLMKNRENRVVVLEDAPHHIQEIAEVSSVERILVFDMPYNRNIQHDKLIRVGSWLDVKEILT